MANMGFAFGRRFLKEYKAFGKFKNEIQYNEYNSYDHYWEYCSSHGLDSNFIMDAFDWDSSREGYEYWDEIDSLWRDHWMG